MGEMRLTEVQKEILEQALRELERVQQQNTIVLTTILAGGDIRVAKGVRHEGDYLRWDEDDTDDSEGPDESVDKVVEQITAEARVEGDPSEPTGPALHEDGDSKGLEASVPESEEVNAKNEPAPKEEPATV